MRIRNEPARVFFGQTVSQRNAFTGHGHVRLDILARERAAHHPALRSGPERRGQQLVRAELHRLIATRRWTGCWTPSRSSWTATSAPPCGPTFQNLYAEELPVLPLYWRANAYILPKWLKGVRPTGHTANTTLWIEELAERGALRPNNRGGNAGGAGAAPMLNAHRPAAWPNRSSSCSSCPSSSMR